MLPGMMPMPGLHGRGGSVPFSVVAQGVDTVDATSFSLNPSALGAQSDDLMVVSMLFEDDATITHPASWTTAVDHEAPQTGMLGRISVDHQLFAGGPPGSQTWTTAGAAGCAYAWTILRGATGIGTITEPFDGTTTPGLVTTALTVVAGQRACLIHSLADGNFETGETATLSGVVAGVSEAGGHVAGRYAMAGYRTTSGDVSFTSAQLNRSYFQQAVVPIVAP